MGTPCSWGARLRRPLFLWAYAALAAQLAMNWLLHFRELGSPAFFVVSFLSPLMWICVFVAFVRAVVKSDEFQRRMHLQAVAMAFVPTVILLLLLSGLESAGIYRATLGDFAILSMLFLLIAYLYTVWKYR